MANTQHPSGPAESPTSAPGTHSASGQAVEPTLHEFLTHLVSDPAARSAFDADPQATLDQFGLGEMSATDVLQATSLVLDYAPVEVVNAYERSLSGSVEKFAAHSQFVAVNELHPAHPHEQEELSMLQNTPQPDDFGKGGDADADMPQQNTDVDIEHNDVDSHNVVNVHDVLSDNTILSGNDISIGDSLNLSAVSASVGSVTSTATNVVDESVNLTGGVGSVVHGDVTGVVGDVASGDVTNVVNNVVSEAPVVGDLNVDSTVNNVTSGNVSDVVSSAPLVGDVASNVTGTVANAPVVGDIAGDVTSGNVTGIAGGVTSTVSEAPVVGDVVGNVTSGDVTGVVGDLPVAGDVAGTATGVVGGLPVAGDLVGDAASGDVVNNVAGTATGLAGDLPVAGDVAGTATGVVGDLPVAGDVAGTATDVVGDLPVAGDLASNVTDTVAGGDVTALPVDDLAGDSVPAVGDVAGTATGALPTDALGGAEAHAGTDAPLAPVGDVASHLPAPSDLPVAGPVAGDAVEGVVGTATDALPLDGLL